MNVVLASVEYHAKLTGKPQKFPHELSSPYQHSSLREVVMSAEDHPIQSRLLSLGTKGIALAVGATAVGAVAAGAVAIGSLAIGALAIRKFVVHRGHIAKLNVGELTVDRLIVNESNSKR